MQKYLENIQTNYKANELKKFNLGLIYTLYPSAIQLVYYGNNGKLKKKEMK